MPLSCQVSFHLLPHTLQKHRNLVLIFLKWAWVHFHSAQGFSPQRAPALSQSLCQPHGVVTGAAVGKVQRITVDKWPTLGSALGGAAGVWCREKMPER